MSDNEEIAIDALAMSENTKFIDPIVSTAVRPNEQSNCTANLPLSSLSMPTSTAAAATTTPPPSSSSLSSSASLSPLDSAQTSKSKNDSTPENEMNSYIQEYLLLFGQSDEISLSKLKEIAINGSLKSLFRSICWRIFLKCLPLERKNWIEHCNRFRNEHQLMKQKYNTDPHNFAHSSGDFVVQQDNPLSQEKNSLWNAYFENTELKTTINQDVIRTFPETDFFQTTEVQEYLSSILFNFAKEHPKVSYKQGMHEVLAPLLFVIQLDHQSFVHAKEMGYLSSLSENLREELEVVLNPIYAEADIYFMFKHIMQVIESWYSQETYPFQLCNNDVQETKTVAEDIVARVPLVFHDAPKSTVNSHHSALSIKLRLIFEEILKFQDPELYIFLQNMQIAPQVFGIRWLRLLFGREFPLQDLLVVWDAIFADGCSFNLCDYLFVAMLLAIRKLLLSSNYIQVMGYLMRYPSILDVHSVIDLAIDIRIPTNNKRRLNFTSQVVPKAGSGGKLSSISSSSIVSSVPSPNGEKQDISLSSRGSVQNSRKEKSRPQSLVLPKKSSNPFMESITQKIVSTVSQATTPVSVESFQPSVTDNENFTNEVSEHKRLLIRKPVAREMKVFESNGIANSSNNQLTYKMDYCWKLIGKQVDVLQSCLSDETNLKHEDALFISLAELKRVRDILKGSLTCPSPYATDGKE